MFTMSWHVAFTALNSTYHLIAAEAGLSSMLASEVARLSSEMKMMQQRLQGYEADVDKLVSTGELGHANPKQKIQYHLRCALIARLAADSCMCTYEHEQNVDLVKSSS